MADISPAVVPADRAVTLEIQRPVIQFIFGVVDVDDSIPGKEVAVAGIAAGHNTVEQIHSSPHPLNDVGRCANPHQIPGLVFGHVRFYHLDDVHESGSLAGTTIEMIPKGFSKAVGIAAVIKIQNIPWEDTIVFGDSNNDLSMFEYAAYKVAMGNSSKKILSLADYVTEDMFHYGIQNGLAHLGLI